MLEAFLRCFSYFFGVKDRFSGDLCYGAEFA